MVQVFLNKHKRHRVSRGVAALEFALMLPFLLLLLGGIIGFGSYFVTQAALAEAAHIIAVICTERLPVPNSVNELQTCAANIPPRVRAIQGVYFACEGEGGGLNATGNVVQGIPNINPLVWSLTVTVTCNTDPVMWTLAEVFFPLDHIQIRGSASNSFNRTP